MLDNFMEKKGAGNFSFREMLEQYAKMPIDVPLESRKRDSEDPHTRLLQRLFDLNQIKTMSAPEIFAEESFPDANIVAEYLENTLDDIDLVAEYEKVCTQSDMLLAELSSCFHLYENRKNISVSVPRHCRHRLYYLACSDKMDTDKMDTGIHELRTKSSEQKKDDSRDRKTDTLSGSDGVPEPDQVRNREKVFIRKESPSPRKSFYGFRTMGILLVSLLLILFFFEEKNREGESVSGDPDRATITETDRISVPVPDFKDPDQFSVYVKSNPYLDQQSENPKKDAKKKIPNKTKSIVTRELFIIPEVNNAVFSR